MIIKWKTKFAMTASWNNRLNVLTGRTKRLARDSLGVKIVGAREVEDTTKLTGIITSKSL